jgi:toxin YoeB
MSRPIEISGSAEKDLKWFREHDRSLYLKCFDLTRALAENAFEGIGKPEHLRMLGGNVWSRRVSHEHRLVYEIFPDRVVIAAYRYHYHGVDR